MRSSKAMPYQPARTIAAASFGWCIAGSFPRLAGILQPKPQFVKIIHIVDITFTSIFVLALIYIIYAIVHNAKRVSHFG